MDSAQTPTETYSGNPLESHEFTLLILNWDLILDLVVKGASLIFALALVGAVGIFMIYILNGIYILGYILVEVVIGDGRSDKEPLSKTSIYQLIYDQILLHKVPWTSWRQDKSKISRTRTYSSTAILGPGPCSERIIRSNLFHDSLKLHKKI